MRRITLAGLAVIAVVILIVLGRSGLTDGIAPPTPPADLDLHPEIREAITEALDLVRGQPDSAAARIRLALTYDANGLDSLAIQAYVQGLDFDDSHAKWWYWKGLAHADVEDIDFAIESVNHALRLDPTYVSGRRQLSLWHLQEGRIDEASRIVDEALIGLPDDPSLLVARARIRIVQRDYQPAADDLVLALRQVPQYKYARLLLGTAYRHLRQMEKAEAQLRLGAGSEPIYDDPWKDEILEHRAGYSGVITETDRLLAHGLTQEAIQKLQSLRAKYPHDVPVLAKLAEAYDYAGRYEEAFRLLKQARDIDPEHLLTRLKLSNHYQRLGLIDEAVQEVRDVLELSPESGTAYRQLGRLEFRRGDLPAAAEALKNAIRFGRNEPDILLMLGQIQIDLKRWEESIVTFVSLREIVPDSPDAFLWLSLARAELGQVAQALPLLQKAMELNPSHPNLEAVRNRLRVLYEHAGGRPPN